MSAIYTIPAFIFASALIYTFTAKSFEQRHAIIRTARPRTGCRTKPKWYSDGSAEMRRQGADAFSHSSEHPKR